MALAPTATHFGILMCLPMASELLLIKERRLRYVADLWAALGQVAACQLIIYVPTESKAQGLAKNLFTAYWVSATGRVSTIIESRGRFSLFQLNAFVFFLGHQTE